MMHLRRLRDGRCRLTLWHHVQPCPDDAARYDLIVERSIPVIILGETCAGKSADELIGLCVKNTLAAYALVHRHQADLPLWGTYVETASGKYSLEAAASCWMRYCGRPLKLWKLTAPRVRRRRREPGSGF